MRRLFVTRQRLVGFLVAVEVANALFLAGIAWSVDGLGSFSRIARDVFLISPAIESALESLGSPRAGPILALLALVLAGSLVDGWLRGCFLLGLVGEGVTFRPPRHVVLRLAAYSALVNVAQLVEVALDENGAAVALVVLVPALSAVTLYADYAIVVDDVGLVEGMRRSWETIRMALGISVALWVLWMVVNISVTAIFDGGFEDKKYVQPTYLVAYLLVRALFQFLTDISLVTVYRATPGRPRPAEED
jgi:hypothetical protein